MNAAIVVAAGRSRRMGFDKLFAPLLDRPTVLWSIEAFAALDEIARVIVVTRPERIDSLRDLIARHGIVKADRILPGGRNRHDSVWAGLQALDPTTELVAVHDGARPLVTASTIRRCLALARECGAAAVAAPVTDTLKRADDALMLSGEINREGLWAMQTPQIFRARLLLDVYRPMIERGETATDETSAVARAGHPVRLCPTDSFNLKITYPNDIQLAGQLLAARAREGGAGGSPFA